MPSPKIKSYLTQEVTPNQRKRILLIPLDSRPAAGQFAQKIAAIADVEVKMPSYEYLGRFTNPGNVNQIFKWLESQDLTNVSAIIASADMLAYGGLIASRENNVDTRTAVSRLRRLLTLKKQAPKGIKLYVFSSTMRLTPTATKETAPYRVNLARYEETKDKYARLGDPSLLPLLGRLKKLVPKDIMDRYQKTRQRNHDVQQALLRMSVAPEFDYLVMGQDDARPTGPQRLENIKLRQLAKALGLDAKVFFCEGIDQHANILVSRALLESKNWKPRVRVVYSDDAGRNKLADYETKSIEASLEYDYSLYLNTPDHRPGPFADFLERLKLETDQGLPVAVADINFGRDGTPDPELYKSIMNNPNSMNLLSFAGWNTAGNTMGTAIPAANVFLYSRFFGVDPLVREVARREFLFLRLADDYSFHKFARPAGYKLLEQMHIVKDEVYGEPFQKLNQLIKADMGRYISELFDRQFKDKKFYAGTKEYAFTRMDALKVFLPWPRAYETRIEFKLIPEQVTVK